MIQPYESQISLIDGPQVAKDPIIEMANALEIESKQLKPYQPKDFTAEFKYSLWTDLCGEQSEF